MAFEPGHKKIGGVKKGFECQRTALIKAIKTKYGSTEKFLVKMMELGEELLKVEHDPSILNKIIGKLVPEEQRVAASSDPSSGGPIAIKVTFGNSGT